MIIAIISTKIRIAFLKRKGMEVDNIQVEFSIAYEPICFIEKRLLKDSKWMNKKQIEEIKYINSLLPADFGDGCIGMSTLCLILSAYTDNNIADTTLDTLIDIFRNPNEIDSVVRKKITGGFTSSYVYPVLDLLKDGFVEDYVNKLSILKDAGFEELYKNRIIPLVETEIEEKEKEILTYDTEALFADISKLKGSQENRNLKNICVLL